MKKLAASAKPKLTRRNFLGLVTAAAAATALDGYAISRNIKFEHHHLTLPSWDAHGFRVVQVSDVHLNNPALRDLSVEAMAIASDLKPDLLVFTGDFVNKATDETLGYVKDVFADGVDVSCPCLAILGNHDYTCKRQDLLFETVARTPFNILINKTFEVGGVSVIGLDDGIYGDPNFGLVNEPKLSRSKLVLMHEPDYSLGLPSPASLCLSGHSHGGEVCLPGGIPIHLPSGAQIYQVGYYPKAPTPLYVSRGVGTLGPCRVFCPPEVTLFTLNGLNA